MEIIIIAWFALAAAFIIGEIFTLDLTLGIFGGAAIAGGITAAAGGPPGVQVGVFALLTLVGVLFIRPVAKRHLTKTRETRTGIDRLPGQAAVVIEPVTVAGGLIKLDGESWTARLDEHISQEPVEEGSRVTVLRIEGATAIVHAID